jgi:hypothetical protein
MIFETVKTKNDSINKIVNLVHLTLRHIAKSMM